MESHCETIVISAAGLGFPRLLGLVAEAEKQGFFHRGQCNCIMATSAGCFIALSLALNLSFEYIIPEIATKMNNRRFHQGSLVATILKGLTNGYILDTEIREEMIDQIFSLAGREKKMTFEELFTETGIRLSFNAVDFDSGKMHYLGYFTTPELSIRSAILASTAVPTLFPLQEIDVRGKTYRFSDGGLYSYLNIDAFSSAHPHSLIQDPFYFGRSVPETYDLAFLTYSHLDQSKKLRNDMFSVMNRMLHILQLGLIERISVEPRVITSCSPSSLSYFSELEQGQIELEISGGREHILHLLKNPELLPISLRCRS